MYLSTKDRMRGHFRKYTFLEKQRVKLKITPNFISSNGNKTELGNLNFICKYIFRQIKAT